MKAMAIAFLAAWAGLTLVLSRLRWFARPSLSSRLLPYAAGGGTRRPAAIVSAASLSEVIAPLSQSVGDALSRALGISEDLGTRLRRLHSSASPAELRVHQLGWAVVALAVGAVAAAALRPPTAALFLVVLGLPALAFLVMEQRLSAASAAWQRAVFLELPVVAEQLAMLLGAGYSLGAALNRLAVRGNGRVARDLTRVCARIRHGASEADALREWAALVAVPALDRLVPVLALNREAADLARLVSEEARAIRRDVHRELIETMERRSQQVWIPVTVATLVPGAIFLSVPFIEALNLFAGT